MATLGEKLLFIFDGFDEMSPDSTNPFVYSILSRSTFPDSTILVTSRPSAVEELREIVKVDYHYKLEGFSTSAVSHYLRTNSSRRNFESLWESLKLNNLINICKNPLVSLIVLKIHQEGSFHLPKTITDFFNKIVFGLVQHSLDPEERASLSSSSCIQLESLLSNIQFGFRPLSSTQEALLSVTNTWHTMLTKHTQIASVFLDVRKAFDSVPHNRLMGCLRHLLAVRHFGQLMSLLFIC